MYKVQPQIRLQAVQHYLNNGSSLMKTAQNFNVHYQSVFKWVKWYKEKGQERLLSTYRRPWNRTKRKTEEKIALLKEKEPDLTVRKARQVLEKQGIKISIKCIWSIWRRYALVKRNRAAPYDTFGPLIPESKDVLKRVKDLLQVEKIKEAADILNLLPSYPKDDILLKIPEKLLSHRRQLDRVYLSFGKISFPEYFEKSRELRIVFAKKGLLYSALLAGLHEIVALNWMKNPAKELELLTLLQKWASGIREPSLQFCLNLHSATANSNLLRIKKIRKPLDRCRRLIKSLPYAFFHEALGSLLTSLTEYRKASLFYQKALKMKSTEIFSKILTQQLAFCLILAGRYRDGVNMLQNTGNGKEGHGSLLNLIQAACSFGQGNLYQASSLYEKALQVSEKGQLRNRIHGACLGLAEIQAALGERRKAKTLLRKYLPLLKKFRMKRDFLTSSLLLKDISLSSEIGKLPLYRLLSLLHKAQKTRRIQDYNSLLRFAVNKGLLGCLHRYIVFFPEVINDRLQTGKSTGLPKAILRLPVFNKEAPVYNIKFLGDFKIKLRPKDTAFLIHLALKAGEPDKKIPLKEIHRNFWKESKNPARNLSHLLVRIKKTLKIPSHLLEISHKRYNPVLVNKGIHFITDYGEYNQTIIQAKALLKVGEWGFAKKEYTRAFKLFRGEPFKKMYDFWSDSMRTIILNKYEGEFINFAKECIARNDYKTARKNLEKVEKIIKYSEEVDKIKKIKCLSP